MWFKKFGRDSKAYNDDIYACDSHFSDEMRIGPYLRREAIPNKNLRSAAAFAKIKKWSLQKLDALSKVPTNTAPTQRPQPNAEAKTFNMEKITVNEPPENANNLNHILVNTTIRLPVNKTLEKPSTALPSSAQSKNDILNRINMTIMPPTNQPTGGSSPVQYVKMHTVGVFVPRRTGYVVSVDKILNAEDPLDINKHMPYDYIGPYDTELNLKVHKIYKEDFGVFSSDDEEEEVNEEEQNGVEGNGNDTASPECDSESDDYEPIPPKRRRDYRNCEIKEDNENSQTNEVGYSAAQTERHASDTDSETETGVSLHLAPVLEQLAATYPPESFSIYINKCNKVVECRKQMGGDTNDAGDVIIPDEPVVISDNEEPACISKSIDNKSNVSTNDGLTLPSQGLTVPQHSKTNFAENFLNQQLQRPNTNLLTKEVALAKSWQQVIKTIDKGLITNSPQDNASVANIAKPKQMESNSNETKLVPIKKDKPTVVASSTYNAKTNATKSAATASSTAAIESIAIDIVDPLVPQVTHNSCILKCGSFRKLYAFPSPSTEKLRRHFWFLELGLNLKTDWHKSLHICDKHFADNMLIEDKLHKYAYPSKSTKLNTVHMEASTQTEDFAAWKDYTALLRELSAMSELDKQQKRVITRTKFLIRLKQEAARLVTEIRNAEGNADDSQKEV